MDYLGRSFPGKELVTNKRPDAFALLGMLKGLVPERAFRQHGARSARDTALSIWFQQFDGRLRAMPPISATSPTTTGSTSG